MKQLPEQVLAFDINLYEESSTFPTGFVKLILIWINLGKRDNNVPGREGGNVLHWEVEP